MRHLVTVFNGGRGAEDQVTLRSCDPDTQDKADAFLKEKGIPYGFTRDVALMRQLANEFNQLPRTFTHDIVNNKTYLRFNKEQSSLWQA